MRAPRIPFELSARMPDCCFTFGIKNAVDLVVQLPVVLSDLLCSPFVVPLFLPASSCAQRQLEPLSSMGAPRAQVERSA